MEPKSGDGGPLDASPGSIRRLRRQSSSSQGSTRSGHKARPKGAEGDGERTVLLPQDQQPGAFTKGRGGERGGRGRESGAVAERGGERREGGRERAEERREEEEEERGGERKRRGERGERRREVEERRGAGGRREPVVAEGGGGERERQGEERGRGRRDLEEVGVREGRRQQVKECNLVPHFVLNNLTLWSSIYISVICLLVAILLTSIGLIIYTTIEIEDILNHKLWMSTTETYNLREWVEGLDLYTNQVCIEQMSPEKFEKLLKSKVRVYMNKTSCTDISEKKRMRKISNSFSSHNYKNGELDFFWIASTNYSFHFNITSVPDTGSLTVYITDDNWRRQCHDENPPSGGQKIVFSFSEENSTFANCTHQSGTTVCESAQVPINETKHYYTCMFFSQPYPGAHAHFDMYIHEVVYEASHSHHQLCNLNESHCCCTYKNILKEAGNPTCVLITTEAKGSHNIARDMPVELTIVTKKKLEGILYSFCAFCIVILILLLVVCMFLYTCYRKGHPGHCCQLNL